MNGKSKTHKDEITADQNDTRGPSACSITRSIGLHNKKIMNELITESTNMETKMLQASKYYYFISHVIFFPLIILHTFIGSFILSFNCYVGGGETCIIDGKVDINCLQNNKDNLRVSRSTVLVVEYVLAALSFVNTILIGAQKAMRPAEKGEMFQLMARKWGSFLRQMVTYKQTTSTVNIRSRRVKSFVVTFNNLVENSPLLPRWLLRTSRHGNNNNNNSSTKSPISMNMRTAHVANRLPSGSMHSTMNFTSFLTNYRPSNGNEKARYMTQNMSRFAEREHVIDDDYDEQRHTFGMTLRAFDKQVENTQTPRLHNAGPIIQASNDSSRGFFGSLNVTLDTVLGKKSRQNHVETERRSAPALRGKIRRSFSLV